MVVTAERAPEGRGVTPAAVSVLTREEIESAPAENLAELLELLPGIQSLFAAPFSGTPPMIGARGFFGGGEAEYVQLRVDGVPVGDVESGLADWRNIRASEIERVELLRGPASSLYGDTALAGVVQVFTRRPAGTTGDRGRAKLTIGSFGSSEIDARWGEAAGAWTLRAGGSASRTDGFRDHSADKEAAGDVSAERSIGAGALRFELAGRTREREEPGSLSREDRRARPRSSDPLFRRDEENVDRGRAALTYRREGRLTFTATAVAAARKSDFVRTLLLAPGFGDRALRELSSGQVSGSFEGSTEPRLFGRAARLLGGVELGREWLHTSYRPVGEDGEVGNRTGLARGHRDRLAAFFLQEFPASARARITAGARWDLLEEDFGASTSRHEAWSPRLGVNVRLGALDRAPVSLFFIASRAFKAPTLDQLYDPRPFPDFQGGTFHLSNPALRPQRAWNLEMGAFRETPRTRMDVSIYWMEVDDEIDFDPATFRYRNIGTSRHEGIEASFRRRLGRALGVSFTYAWTRAEPLAGENRGRQLKNIPEHMLRAVVDATLPGAVRASLLYALAARRYLDDGNVYFLEDAGTLDLRIARAFGRWRARVDLLNLTDKEYPLLGFALPDFRGGAALYEYPAPGFSARAGVDVSF